MPDKLMFEVPKEWVPAKLYKEACTLLSDFSRFGKIERVGCSLEYYCLTKSGMKRFKKLDDVLLTKCVSYLVYLECILTYLIVYIVYLNVS